VADQSNSQQCRSFQRASNELHHRLNFANFYLYDLIQLCIS
jgi:hypothetical protein